MRCNIKKLWWLSAIQTWMAITPTFNIPGFFCNNIFLKSRKANIDIVCSNPHPSADRTVLILALNFGCAVIFYCHMDKVGAFQPNTLDHHIRKSKYHRWIYVIPEVGHMNLNLKLHTYSIWVSSKVSLNCPE